MLTVDDYQRSGYEWCNGVLCNGVLDLALLQEAENQAMNCNAENFFSKKIFCTMKFLQL